MKQKVIHETNDSTKRIIWWRARCVDLDCRNQAIFEFEIFRDGIEMEFVSIELIINQFSNNERKKVENNLILETHDGTFHVIWFSVQFRYC